MIKKRGVDVVPEALVQKLKLKGSVTGTIVMTRVAGDGCTFLIEHYSYRIDSQ